MPKLNAALPCWLLLAATMVGQKEGKPACTHKTPAVLARNYGIKIMFGVVVRRGDFFRYEARGELLDQAAVGLLGLGHHHEAAGVLVQPVDDPRSVRFTDRRQTAQAVKQRVDERAGRISGSGMHDQTGRLVDDDQVTILGTIVSACKRAPIPCHGRTVCDTAVFKVVKDGKLCPHMGGYSKEQNT